MSGLMQVWPEQDFDAFDIRLPQCKADIQGIEGDRVILEGGQCERLYGDFHLEVIERRLIIDIGSRFGGYEFKLGVPRNKVWGLNLFCGRGEIKVRDIQSRARLMLGHGDIHVENCGGQIEATGGHGGIEIKHFAGSIISGLPSNPPPGPQDQPGLHDQPDDVDRRSVRGRHWKSAIDWEEILCRKVVPSNINQPYDDKPYGDRPQDAGLTLRLKHGNIRLEDIAVSSIFSSQDYGDFKLEKGRPGILDVDVGRGNIECREILPEANWQVKTSHGDIKVSLPFDVGTRLDMATRHGDLRSELPMVRVARQGPGNQRGGRMVGTVGPLTAGPLPELHLTVLHGDIEIKTGKQYQFSSQNINDRGGQQAMIGPAEKEADTKIEEKEYQSPLEVLEALGKGQISVEEAERLLRKMEV